jgi:hypothetical protein
MLNMNASCKLSLKQSLTKTLMLAEDRLLALDGITTVATNLMQVIPSKIQGMT